MKLFLYYKYDSIQKNPFQAPWGDKILLCMIKKTQREQQISTRSDNRQYLQLGFNIFVIKVFLSV